mmetsp:Transcript_7305/g.19160  ORF Transcript_7305/g.19160 Transcript_7305/m.19160 type:complete len:208 (-) Transcript_7305:325-948(-)
MCSMGLSARSPQPSPCFCCGVSVGITLASPRRSSTTIGILVHTAISCGNMGRIVSRSRSELLPWLVSPTTTIFGGSALNCSSVPRILSSSSRGDCTSLSKPSRFLAGVEEAVSGLRHMARMRRWCCCLKVRSSSRKAPVSSTVFPRAEPSTRLPSGTRTSSRGTFVRSICCVTNISSCSLLYLILSPNHELVRTSGSSRMPPVSKSM